MGARKSTFAACSPSTRSALSPVATPVALVVNGLPGVALRLDPAGLVAVRLEVEGATVLEVVGPDACLAPRAGAAAVDRSASVAVADVGLARPVGLRRGDHLGLAVGGPAAGVALALAKDVSRRAHGERGYRRAPAALRSPARNGPGRSPGAGPVWSWPRSGPPPPSRRGRPVWCLACLLLMPSAGARRMAPQRSFSPPERAT